MTDEQLLARNRRFLVAYYKAKPKEDATDKDYLVTYTERNQWILSPRSTVTKQRKVITCL